MQERRSANDRGRPGRAVALALVLTIVVGGPPPRAAASDPPTESAYAPTADLVGAAMAPVEASEAPIRTWASPIGPVSYTPGRGLRVGDTGLTLGGSSNLILFRDEGREAHLHLDDLSLFVIWEPISRVRLFSELEYEDVFDIDTEGRSESPDEAATVERLYLDLGVSDRVNLRTGIFLTPVGRWNQIHAAPLVWTTSRPLTTELPFDPNVTGAMIWGSVFPSGGTLTYTFYDQFAGPIEGNPSFHPADHSAGARLQYDADRGWSVGTSYLAALRNGDWNHLGGLDFLWSRRPLEIMGEAIVEAGTGTAPQWGFYVQPVLAVSTRLALVTRYEHFAAPGPPPQVNIMTFGLAFRLLPTVVLKTEYQVVDRHADIAPAGFRASIAALF